MECRENQKTPYKMVCFFSHIIVPLGQYWFFDNFFSCVCVFLLYFFEVLSCQKSEKREWEEAQEQNSETKSKQESKEQRQRKRKCGREGRKCTFNKSLHTHFTTVLAQKKSRETFQILYHIHSLSLSLSVCWLLESIINALLPVELLWEFIIHNWNHFLVLAPLSLSLSLFFEWIISCFALTDLVQTFTPSLLLVQCLMITKRQILYPRERKRNCNQCKHHRTAISTVNQCPVRLSAMVSVWCFCSAFTHSHSHTNHGR